MHDLPFMSVHALDTSLEKSTLILLPRLHVYMQVSYAGVSACLSVKKSL